MRAIEWIIKRSSLPVEAFHQEDKPVIVEAEILGVTDDILSGLDSKHKDRIQPLVVDERIRFRRVQDEPGLPGSKIYLDVYKDSDWVANPNGIDAAVSALFPEPIFIGAMENAGDDVAKFGSGTVIGKLIKEIMDQVAETQSSTVTNALKVVERSFSANADKKDKSLMKLDERIQENLSQYFPGVSAKVHIPVPDILDFIKSATIRIFEDGCGKSGGRDVFSFGHGTQRSIQIALVQCLAKVRKEARGSAPRTTLLLIDEPELYLHPQAIEAVRAALNRLAGDHFQIVFSTHSSNMISHLDVPNTLLIRRNSTEGTRCNQRISDAVNKAIKGTERQAEALFALSNSSKILFSERVVIVEGKTERIVLPAIFNKEFKCTPDEDGLGLVDIGGVSNIPNSMNVLKSMGVPCKAIVDLDFVFNNNLAKQFLSPEDEDLIKCKSFLDELRNVEMTKKRTGETADIDSDRCIEAKAHLKNGAVGADDVKRLANHDEAKCCIVKLHEKLKSKGVWMWTLGAIESHLAMEKGRSAPRKFIENLANDGFTDTIPEYKFVKDAMEWLRS